MYEDRSTAGEILGERLASQGIDPDVMLAVPPGGIDVARPIADRFDAPLGVLVSEPIQTAQQFDYPLGAVTDTGVSWIEDELLETFDVDEERIEAEKKRAFREARDKHDIYDRTHDVIEEAPTPTGVVAIVDDGVTDGVTVKAGLSALEQVEDCYSVAAAPIGTPTAVADLHTMADDVVVDETIENDRILGQFYEQGADAATDFDLSGVH